MQKQMINFDSSPIPVGTIKFSYCNLYVIQRLETNCFKSFYHPSKNQWYLLGQGTPIEVEKLCNLHANGEIISLKVESPLLNRVSWLPRTEPPEFNEGDKYLVAVACVDEEHKWYWETACVTVKHNEYSFEFILNDGCVWEFDWTYVEYWIPLDQLTNLLPRLL